MFDGEGVFDPVQNPGHGQSFGSTVAVRGSAFCSGEGEQGGGGWPLEQSARFAEMGAVVGVEDVLGCFADKGGAADPFGDTLQQVVAQVLGDEFGAGLDSQRVSPKT